MNLPPPSPETKPGYQTTEFWLTVLFSIWQLLNVTSIWDYMPKSWSGIAIAIVTALYTLSRGQAKQGVPYYPPGDVAPPARTTTPTRSK